MTDTELVFRWVFGLVLAICVLISGYYRRRARRSGETIARRSEGPLVLGMRLAGSLAFLAVIAAYLFMPDVLASTRVELPLAARLVGAGVALVCPFLVWWVMISIGNNISETVLTKANHQLVVHGPYQWVRHPLYAVALLALLALSVMAANGLLLVMWAFGLATFRWVVIPREEVNLIQKFGSAYEQYRARTGALVPRLGGRAA